VNIERTTADFAATAQPPKTPLEIMRLALFDWSVCAIAGRSEPVARILRDHAKAEGTAGSAVIVGGGAAGASRAALINGATSHALDYDDTHFAHIGHTSVAVIPAALAVLGDGSLHALLEAALIGSEVAVRVGLWLGRDHYQVGFHQTATAGAFGAAMAAGRLLDLSQPQLVTALGLAATKAAGLKSQFGTMGKPLNAGLAAETGVLAAQWAKAGMTSAGSGLSGELGFGATHHGMADMDAFEGLSDTWLMEHVSHKFHACCHGLHAMLEALRDVSGPVARLTVLTHPRWLTVCNNLAPRTGLECKFSYAMTAAMTLSGVDTARIESFDDGTAVAPELIALRDRVTVVPDEVLTEMQARVDICREDGTNESVFHDLNVPLGIDERQQRLVKKARAVVGTAMADDLWAAAQSDHIDVLTELLQRP
jgi:2-methylcitrate dehydratase PrpD